MIFKIGVLRKLAKFTGRYLCQSIFFNESATFLKKRSLGVVRKRDPAIGNFW